MSQKKRAAAADKVSCALIILVKNSLCLSGVVVLLLTSIIAFSHLQRRGISTPATANKSKPESVQRAHDMFAKKGSKGAKQGKQQAPKPALQAAADAQRKAANKANKASKAGKVISAKPKGGSGSATPGKRGRGGPSGGTPARTPGKNGKNSKNSKNSSLGLNVKTPKGVNKRKQAVQGKSALAVALQGGGSFSSGTALRDNIRISIGAPAGNAKKGAPSGVMGVKTASRARASALQGAGRAARAAGVSAGKRANAANARRGLIKPGRDVPAGASAAALQRVQPKGGGNGGQRKGGNKAAQGGRLRQPGIRKL